MPSSLATRIVKAANACGKSRVIPGGADEIQFDLFLDYAGNVALYPAFQAYFRTSRPPLLAVWGRNDPFYLPALPTWRAESSDLTMRTHPRSATMRE